MEKRSTFVRVRPDESDPGWRWRVEREPGEMTIFAEEKVTSISETAQPLADVAAAMTSQLTEAEVRWLHTVLGELVAVFDAEDAEIRR